VGSWAIKFEMSDGYSVRTRRHCNHASLDSNGVMWVDGLACPMLMLMCKHAE